MMQWFQPFLVRRPGLARVIAFWFVVATATSLSVACNGLLTVTGPEYAAALPTRASTAAPIPLTAVSPPAPTLVTLPPTRLLQPTPTLRPTATPSPEATAVPTGTPWPTLDAYAGLGIPDLAARSYGGGELQIVRTLQQKETFARYLVRYPSDGLMIYGFMNVPHEGSQFPVALVLHGYMPVDQYQTLTYTTRYADALAEAGFLVIHPNFRGHPPSDHGPNPFRVGYALDVLNLVAILQEHGGQPTGPLRRANPGRIHLLGHSMGGGIALRVITVNPAIRSAVLYASMSGDERRNFEYIARWSQGERGREELGAPEEALARIAPIYFLDRIEAAVAIHHGTADDITPLAWSEELCGQLRLVGKRVECFIYNGQPHTFRGESDQLFMSRVVEFMNRH